MNDFFKQLHTEGQKVRLSEAEKSAMRERLLAHIGGAEPLRPQAPARPVASPYARLFPARVLAPMLALLVIVAGSGTAAAAQGALPGDRLYPVKVGFNEKVEEAFAVGTEAKVQVKVALAERRIEEAETLAAEGRLTEEMADALAEKFDKHIREAENFSLDLAAREPATAAKLSVEFDSALAAHGAILEKLGGDSRSGATKEFSEKLAKRFARASKGGSAVTSVTIASATARTGGKTAVITAFKASTSPDDEEGVVTTTTLSVTAESTSSPGVAPQEQQRGEESRDEAQKSTAEQFSNQAEARLKEARERYGDVQKKLSASTTAQIDARLAAEDRQMAEGKAALEQGEYDVAAELFRSVMTRSIALTAYVRAGALYNSDIIGPLLDSPSDGDRDDDDRENDRF